MPQIVCLMFFINAMTIFIVRFRNARLRAKSKLSAYKAALRSSGGSTAPPPLNPNDDYLLGRFYNLLLPWLISFSKLTIWIFCSHD